MNYEDAAQRFTAVRREIDALEAAHKKTKAALTEKLQALERWFTAKAQEDGLDSVKTSLGTGYWTTHYTAKVASREDFFKHCQDNDLWDMVESRASKLAVRSFIESTGSPPPGIDFSSIKVFNFRKAQVTD